MVTDILNLEQKLLQEEDIESINDYLDSCYISAELLSLVRKRTERIGNAYRGLTYRKDDIKVGHIYKNDQGLSSWSTDRSVALKFTLDDDVPEWALDKLFDEKYLDKKPDCPFQSRNKLVNEFVPILLFDEDAEGFYINKYYDNHEYSIEEEILVTHEKWIFTDIIEFQCLGRLYYEIYVKRI